MCRDNSARGGTVLAAPKENKEPIKLYLAEIKKALESGDATEHTHRPALKDLIEALG